MTDRDTVRLLIADTDTDNQLLTDDQLDTFLTLEAGSIKRAAAQALDTIASSEVLVGKVIRTQDLQTDASKVAAALREHATSLRQQAEEGDEGFFDIVSLAPTWPPELAEHSVVTDGWW